MELYFDFVVEESGLCLTLDKLIFSFMGPDHDIYIDSSPKDWLIIDSMKGKWKFSCSDARCWRDIAFRLFFSNHVIIFYAYVWGGVVG